jgi:hypothetical protein
MTRGPWIGLGLLLAATVALADDPPAAAPRHENRVSPEAKAAMEKFRSLVYRPAEHGLVSATGEIVAAGFPSRVRSTFEFTPPGRMKTAVPPVLDEEKRRLKLTGNLIDYPLSTSVDASDVFDDWQCDAEVADGNGARVLRLSAFRDGKPTANSEFEFDAAGLVVRHTWRAQNEDPRGDYVEKYTWTKFGDLHCPAAIEVTFEGAEAPHYACAFRYTDAGGIRFVSSYDMTYFAKGVAPRTFSFHVDDLAVNGTKVDLPTPWKHANVVSPEAKAAIERYAKLVDRPTEHGLTSLTGNLVQADAPSVKPRGFSFTVADHVDVDAAPGADPKAGSTRMGSVMLGLPLEATLSGVPIADGGEYDAEFVERDGARALVVTNYKDGAKKRIDEFTLDATGLVASASIGTGAPGGGIAMTMRLSWEKSGERSRIRAIEWTTNVGAGAGSSRLQYELEYGEVGGIAMVTAYTFAASAATGEQSVDKKATFHLADLVLNGAKVEPPKPASGDGK